MTRTDDGQSRTKLGKNLAAGAAWRSGTVVDLTHHRQGAKITAAMGYSIGHSHALGADRQAK